MARKCSRVLSPDRNRTWKIMSENSGLPLAAMVWGNGLLHASSGRWLYQKSSTNGESLELFLLLQWKSPWWWWLSLQRRPSRNCLFPMVCSDHKFFFFLVSFSELSSWCQAFFPSSLTRWGCSLSLRDLRTTEMDLGKAGACLWWMLLTAECNKVPFSKVMDASSRISNK